MNLTSEDNRIVQITPRDHGGWVGIEVVVGRGDPKVWTSKTIALTCAEIMKLSRMVSGDNRKEAACEQAKPSCGRARVVAASKPRPA